MRLIGIGFKKSRKSIFRLCFACDGECNEGSVWEAAMSAPHFKLLNLIAIVDLNSMQSDGRTCDVMNVHLENMWKGFGWT